MTAAAGSPGDELVREVGRRLRWLGLMAGAAGSLVLFVMVGFLIPIFVPSHDHGTLAGVNAPLIVFCVLAGTGLNTRIFRRHMRRAAGWIREGREPSVQEHRMTLGLALYGVKLTGAAWAVAAVIFVAVNTYIESLAFGLVVGATIWLGAETTCAILYLAAERVLRPITAEALAVRLPDYAAAPGVRARMAMAWALGTGVPLFGIAVLAVVGLAEPDVDGEYIAAAILFMSFVAWGAGLLATLFAAKAVAHPIGSVRRGLEQVERGELDTAHVAVDDGSEVGLLQAGFNRMADGLRDRERIRDLFGRQVGEDVARAALREGTRLGGEERDIGALYIDLVGSTSMALAMPPSEVVRVLNRFFRIVVDAVEGEGGLVNKFEGDAALCVFGAPVARDDPADDALRCARTLAARLAREVRELDFGIGISAGSAVAGNVGAERRFEYTVIGDPVNEAARLSELAKQRPERVLASDSALVRAGETERSEWNVTESAVLRGRTVATRLAHPRSEPAAG